MVNKLHIGQKYLFKMNKGEDGWDKQSGIFQGTSPHKICSCCGENDHVIYKFRCGMIRDNLYRFEDLDLCEDCFDIEKELY